MADEVESTVKTTSDGLVSITVEKYDELLRKAEQKPPVIQNVTRNVQEVIKTPEMAAHDNKVWGITFLGIGAGLVLVGAIRLKVGINQTKELLKS